jgi:preprotein translocase subunit SecE
VARDRKRAKQRKARRAEQNPSVDPAADQSQLAREDLPGQLEHASANVDQFDAALVAGAEGVTADGAAPDDGVMHPEGLTDEDFAELEDRIDGVEETIEEGDQEEIERVEGELDEDITERGKSRAAATSGASAPVATKRGPGRFVAFLRASWAELQRVQWPDRRQVGQATAVVLGFVVIAGAYLGLADALAQKIVDLII